MSQLKLRFFPAGYLTSIQFRQKYMYAFRVVAGWSCMGIYAPNGTALRVQFFIGSQQSPVTDIYFDDKSMHPAQLWEPPVLDAPNFGPDDELVVGVDIFENLRYPRYRKASDARLTRVGEGLITRSLSDLSPSPWFDPEERKRALQGQEEMSLTGKTWNHGKRYHPGATNVLTTSSERVTQMDRARKAAYAAVIHSVETLPELPDEPKTP